MSPGSHLGQYLGCKDPAHIARWHAAMMAGRRAAPKCEALTREGKSCRRDRLYGADRCSHHLKGRERDAIDAIRLERAYKAVAVANNAVDRAEALKATRNIQRRALHRAWLNHPEIEGSTLELHPHEEERVRAFLRDELALDVELPDPVTGRALTPRALDRARWAGCLRLKDRLDPEAARRRVAGLLRDERRYWARRAPP